MFWILEMYNLLPLGAHSSIIQKESEEYEPTYFFNKLYLFVYFGFTCGMQDLCSPARDQIHVSYSGSMES